jgi:hypothetical protein
VTHRVLSFLVGPALQKQTQAVDASVPSGTSQRRVSPLRVAATPIDHRNNSETESNSVHVLTTRKHDIRTQSFKFPFYQHRATHLVLCVLVGTCLEKQTQMLVLPIRSRPNQRRISILFFVGECIPNTKNCIC